LDFPAIIFCVKGWPELSHGRAFLLRNHRTGRTIEKNPYAPPGGSIRACRQAVPVHEFLALLPAGNIAEIGGLVSSRR